ncbi:hypothetical protein ACFT7S_11300 [Streptomyces sp. NPDC057136]|uniref:hypothetical protein n=1 Tax=Streptomyces sp. NPDC057136 TaxID=3346029 RepID=UPI0036298994
MTKIVKHSVKPNVSVPFRKTDDMTAPIQSALDGTVPVAPLANSRRQSEDYETWLADVWPKFIDAAATGRTFTCYEIVDAHKLPDPPNPQAHWGRLMTLLRDEGYIRTAGWACSDRPTVHHSGVRTWKGTAAARREAVA